MEYPRYTTKAFNSSSPQMLKVTVDDQNNGSGDKYIVLFDTTYFGYFGFKSNFVDLLIRIKIPIPVQYIIHCFFRYNNEVK